MALKQKYYNVKLLQKIQWPVLASFTLAWVILCGKNFPQSDVGLSLMGSAGNFFALHFCKGFIKWSYWLFILSISKIHWYTELSLLLHLGFRFAFVISSTQLGSYIAQPSFMFLFSSSFTEENKRHSFSEGYIKRQCVGMVNVYPQNTMNLRMCVFVFKILCYTAY